MKKKYTEFLTNKKLVESRIIYELSKVTGTGIINLSKYFVSKDNNLDSFINHYDMDMCSFEQEVVNMDIENVMDLAKIDCSFEYLDSESSIDGYEEEADAEMVRII